MIQVKTFYAHNELRNFSYAIYDDTTGDTWVIDPYEAQPVIDFIKQEGLYLKGILNTHQHFDHTRGNFPLQKIFSAPVKKLNNSDKIRLNEKHELETLDTPGHTFDHQAFIWKENGRPLAVFSGDALFNAGVGNCKNGGKVEILFETTQKLIHLLPEETVLYPGHDYVLRNLEFAKRCEPSNKDVESWLLRLDREVTEQGVFWSLKEEKKVNPFLRLDSQEIRQIVLDTPHSIADERQLDERLFFKLRGLRDSW